MHFSNAHIVVIGVCGCGKSSVGKALSDRLSSPFLEGDAYHPTENREKMSCGIPLEDCDRWEWLERIGRTLGSLDGPGVASCSALKRPYRDLLRRHANGRIGFVHLNPPRQVLWTRLASRTEHFMSPSLLDSQLATLEPLAAGEHGLEICVDEPPDDIVERILAWRAANDHSA